MDHPTRQTPLEPLLQRGSFYGWNALIVGLALYMAMGSLLAAGVLALLRLKPDVSLPGVK